jgi:Tfp pilus assembly protein PilF
MARSTTLPTLSLLNIRLGALAAGGSLALLVAAACGGTDDGAGKAIDIIPVTEYVAPVPADPVTVEAAGFVVPENVSYAMAESVFAQRRYSEATAMFEVVTSRKPENPWNHYMLGLSAWKGGDRERAESAFTAALELDPTHLKSELNMTRVLLEMQRPEDALAHIEKGLAIDSSSAEAWRLLGRVRSELREVEPALAAYRKAVALDEKDAWSMNNMGLVLINAGRHGEAIGPLARAIELRPDVAVFQNNLGSALERTGQFAAAAGAYRKAVESDSSYTKAVVSLARVEVLKEDPTLVPVDLPALAQTFALEIQGTVPGTLVVIPPPVPVPDQR